MRIGRLSRLFAGADRGECLRCRTRYGRSLVTTPGHLTIAESPLLPSVIPVDPLCAPCWRDLTPAERAPYYQRWWIENRGPNPKENEIVWAAIEFALAAGA